MKQKRLATRSVSFLRNTQHVLLYQVPQYRMENTSIAVVVSYFTTSGNSSKFHLVKCCNVSYNLGKAGFGTGKHWT